MISNVAGRFQRHLTNASNNLSKLNEELAGGKRNLRRENPAALSVASDLEAKIAILNQAVENTSHGEAVTNIQDSGLEQIGNQIDRLRELSIQSANGLYSDEQRKTINQEAQALKEEIVRTAQTAGFNGQKVLTNGEDIRLQVGVDGDPNSRLTLGRTDISTELAELSNLDISTLEGAADAISRLGGIRDSVSAKRGDVGASQSRLGMARGSAVSSSVAHAQSLAEIADTDIPETTARSVAERLKQNASSAMLVHSMNDAKNVLRLLG